MVGMTDWGNGARIACLAVFVAAFLCISSSPAESQAEPESEDDADTPTTLDAISITATRNPLETFEYPGMVTVVGRREIQARQPSTPDDILRFVPGVEFTGGPRRTGETPSIRGFGGADVIVTH